MVVWSLFDDNAMSYHEALKDYEWVQNYSVGILEHKEVKNYYKIDLSVFNDKLIKELSKLPKPDLILASPPCESWSYAMLIKNYRYITQDNIKITNYKEFMNENEHLHFKQDFFKRQRTRLLGESCALGIVEIIRFFRPKFWVIENPRTSKIWDYFQNFLDFQGIKNFANYNDWDNTYSKKPTCFYSNIDLGIKLGNVKSSIKWSSVSGYKNRSAIPKELIKYILETIEFRRKTEWTY